MVETQYYTNGNLWYEIPYNKDKKRHGLVKWYFMSGKIHKEIPYKNGKKDGVEISYMNKKGKFPIRKSTYKNGLKHGDEIDYFNDKTIRSIYPYKNGKLEGVSKYYWNEDSIMSEDIWKNDLLHGICKEYDYMSHSSYVIEEKHYNLGELIAEIYYNKDGSLKNEYCWGNGSGDCTSYKDGQIIGCKKYLFESGNVCSEVYYKNGIPIMKRDYYQNRQLSNECCLENGLLNGISTGYFKDGTIKHEITWKDNREDGLCKWYHENGKLHIECNYILGEKDGIERQYHKNGKIYYEKLWEKGKNRGEKWYSKKGILEYEIPPYDKVYGFVGVPKTLYYNEDGSLKNGLDKVYRSNKKIDKEVVYKNGLKNSDEIYYHTNGVINTVTPFIDGVANGVYKAYNTKGEIIEERIFLNGELFDK